MCGVFQKEEEVRVHSELPEACFLFLFAGHSCCLDFSNQHKSTFTMENGKNVYICKKQNNKLLSDYSRQ